MRTYCINCLDRTDRYTQAKKELIKNGFNNVNWIRNKKNKIGHKGCFLSHLDCYIDFLKSKDEKCIIFEDDLKFINKSKNNKKKIVNIINSNSNFDILYLGYNHFPSFSPKNNNNPLFIKGIFVQAHSYVIGRKTAKTIINYYNNKYSKKIVPVHIDLLLNSQKLNTYGLKKRLCIQRRSKSSNKWGLGIEKITMSKNYEKNQLNNNNNFFSNVFLRLIFSTYISILKT